jgi:hypothetical protein
MKVRFRDMEESKEELPLVPERERIDTHGFDVGKEHASGWSVKSANPKPVGGAELDPEKNPMEALVVHDAGEVNRVQYERIKELKMPLSDNAAQRLPVTIRSGNAPDFKAESGTDMRPLTSSTITTPMRHVPVEYGNEALKMGLKRTYSDMSYAKEARNIRYNDRHVATTMRPDLACDYTLAPSAGDIPVGGHSSTGGGYDDRLKSFRRVKYNSLIVPGQTFAARGFVPLIGPTSFDTTTEMPGSVACAFVPRDDTFSGDQLEKIVVVHPEATQNALDKGIFSPQYRNMGEYPSVIRSKLVPFR